MAEEKLYYQREIQISEMPQGCFITKDDKTILISSPDDAISIIESLNKMLRIQYSEILDKVSLDFIPDKPLWWWRCDCKDGFPLNRIENSECPVCGAIRPVIALEE